VSKLELQVAQDRQGRFSTEVFVRYQRSEKPLVSALTEMYVQGVSTRKVKAISQELYGHEFSATTISELNKKLDEELRRFARRGLEVDYPHVIVDARYEKVREEGVIRSRAVLVAVRDRPGGVPAGDRCRSCQSRKRHELEFLVLLKQRGLSGVYFIVSDDHSGLKRAIMEVLPEACWQRCYVHFLRNALDAAAHVRRGHFGSV
jgi:putative transposase